MTPQRLAHVFLLAAALAAVAEAQTNSLFRGSSRMGPAAAPTSQPIGGATELLLPLPGSGLQPQSPTPAAAPGNEYLLRRSLIAVTAPQPKKVQVHDLVTIIVREDKRASTDSNLKSDKNWEIKSELAKWFRISDARWLAQDFERGTPEADFSFDNQYEGKGQVERQDTLTLRITAEIIDVKPNGTLVLEARKVIENDEDKQTITLTGICRSEDVTAQNTVLSTQLADATVNTQHEGPARDAARRGWLMKALDKLRPF